jgi:Spy/CpxP family protein refolding chaperone
MRNLNRVVLTLGVAVLLACPAPAQQRQRGGFGFGGLGFLVQNEGVQKELKLDKEQIDKAKDAVQKVREKHQDEFAKLRDLGREEAFEKMQAINKTVTQETVKALEDILKPEQLKRLKQIELQQRGYVAFSDPEVQKSLKLTDEQKGKIKTIVEDAGKEMRELFQGGDFQAAQKKMPALRKETMDKVSAILKDDQKQAWKDMTGQPFEVRFERRRDQ